MSARRSRRQRAPEAGSSKSDARTSKSHTRSQFPDVAVFAALALLVVLAYLPVLTTGGGWLWDDDGHVTKAALRSADGLRRIWFDVGATQQYYPLVHSAFWVLSHLFGTDSPVAYHWVSVLLHAASAFLVFLTLRRLVVPGAIVAALLFLLHPIQVESVAWTSELKNTLSGVFFFAAAYRYIGFDATRDQKAYAWAIVLFLLALLSKSVTATLPAILLVVVWWRRGMLEWKRDVLPLAPLAGLAMAAGLTTAWFERTVIGASGGEFQFGFLERGLIAGRALWFYASALVWPVHFSFNYPRWQISQLSTWQFIFPIGVALVSGGLWRLKQRAALAGVLVFCLGTAPALGFVNVYPFRFSFVADHFQYHAGIGLLALVAAALVALSARLKLSRMTSTVALAVILLGLGGATYARARDFVDGATLYQATITQNPESWLAHNNLAALMLTGDRRDLPSAIAHTREALRLKPDYLEARFNLAIALDDSGRSAEAISEYRELLAQLDSQAGVRARRATVARRLGLALARSGKSAEAIPYFREAAALEPTNAEPLINLGAALLEQGNLTEAARALEDALRQDPAAADAHHNLGSVYLLLRRYQDAVREFDAEVRLRPGDAQAQAALARARQLAGR